MLKPTRRTLAGWVAIAALMGISVVGTQPAMADDKPSDSVDAYLERVKERGTVRVVLELGHTVRLSDAIEAAAKLDDTVVAYGFTQDSIEGEYSPSMPMDEFLQYFAEDYGTEPEISSIILVRASDGSDRTEIVERSDLARAIPAFDAAPVTFGGRIADRLDERKAVWSDRTTDVVVQRNPPDWRPDFTAQAALNRGTQALVSGYFEWHGYGLDYLPDDIGLEFEVNLRDESVAYPDAWRPFCNITIKDEFWAKNYGYTWVASNLGSGGALGSTYADYNDLTDTCSLQSIAIGARYPKNLTYFFGPGSERALDIAIYTAKGSASSNWASGNVQAVTDTYCHSGVWALTDCMGVTNIGLVWGGYPTGEYNMLTMNFSKSKWVPNYCWRTDNGVWAEVTPCS